MPFYSNPSTAHFSYQDYRRCPDQPPVFRFRSFGLSLCRVGWEAEIPVKGTEETDRATTASSYRDSL